MKKLRQSAHAEAGYVLLAVLLMLALFLIAMAIAAPKIAADLQRDKEQELIHRGMQYKRAIKLYYKRFGRYPSSIDQLESTNNMRFLRKRYTDPITGKDDWKPVYFGQAHVKAMGFFNHPISGGGLSATAGGSVLGGAPASGIGSTSSLGGPTMGGGIGLSSGVGNSGSNFGSGSSFGSDSGSANGPGNGLGNSSGNGSGPGNSGSGSSSGSSFGSGGPIVGVVSPNTKPSIAIYKLMTHYNQWEFVYDPVEEMMSQALGMGGGGPVNNPGPGLNNSGGAPGFGGGSGPGSGSGFGGGFGSSPQQPAPAPPPQAVPQQ